MGTCEQGTAVFMWGWEGKPVPPERRKPWLMTADDDIAGEGHIRGLELGA